MPPSDHDAGSVLKELGLDPGAAPLHALGQAGGFSGASLWRVESGHGSYCLRAWPPTMTADRIAFIHQAQAELTSAGLEFIPALHASRAGATWVCRDNRYWELAGWRPGAADFRQRPNPQRLRNAVTALARVHAVWARGRSAAAGPSQAVRQRHQRLRAWDDAAFQRAAAALRQIQDPVWERLLREGLLALRERRAGALETLAPWLNRFLPQQRVLADVWHDHLLFSGDELTGLIDLGALREDAVSVDLARLLESCVGQDQARWSAAVAGYRQSAPLTPDQEALAVALIQSGSAAGLETWLRWLLIDKRAFEDTERVRARLTELLLGATIGRGALERGVSAPDQVR